MQTNIYTEFKSTGIVRRIDDLGRVVIPKELRRQMRIKEGDPLELFVSEDGVIHFKKYDPSSPLTILCTDIKSIIEDSANFEDIDDGSAKAISVLAKSLVQMIEEAAAAKHEVKYD